MDICIAATAGLNARLKHLRKRAHAHEKKNVPKCRKSAVQNRRITLKMSDSFDRIEMSGKNIA